MSGKSVFVYIDESGNFDFSETGTEYLVLSAVVFRKPSRSHSRMYKLKMARFEKGFHTPGFHASEDRTSAREEVFRTIQKDRHIESLTLALDKRVLLNRPIRATEIYKGFGLVLAEQLRVSYPQRRVILIFDKAFTAKDESALLSSLKIKLAEFHTSYYIYFQSVSKDLNAQIADYVAWAHFVYFERKKDHWISKLPRRLRHLIQVELDS